MTEENLKKLIDQLRVLPSETEWVEFKENRCEKTELGKYISALVKRTVQYKGKKLSHCIANHCRYHRGRLDQGIRTGEQLQKVCQVYSFLGIEPPRGAWTPFCTTRRVDPFCTARRISYVTNVISNPNRNNSK